MRPDLAALAEQPLDLLVIGGGILGAAAARDAAHRGWRVGLVEARDFGSGTTGASTRLAHGGLRYLQRLDIAQVREGLQERAWLLRAAPHLVQPLPFLLPLREGHRLFRLELRAALATYDALAPPGLPHHRFLSASEARAAEPSLRSEGLAGAAEFHDARIVSVERLVIEFLLDAALHGAFIANHAEVLALERASGSWVVTLAGAEGPVRARAVLNCTGPWAERLLARAGLERTLLRATRGTHVAFDTPLQRALILRAQDGRTFFAVPWNEVTLVGTTDVDEAGDPGGVVASHDEIRYVLEEAARFVELPGSPAYTTAGVRALRRVDGVAPGAVPRRHETIDHARDGLPGLFTVIGGKITTARPAAADALARVARFLGQKQARAPADALPGGRAEGRSDGPSSIFGARASGDPTAVCPRHATRGMVELAVREEWCTSLPDLMFRRTLCGHASDLGAHALEPMLAELAVLLDWGPGKCEVQRRAWEQEAQRRRAGLAAKS